MIEPSANKTLKVAMRLVKILQPFVQVSQHQRLILMKCFWFRLVGAVHFSKLHICSAERYAKKSDRYIAGMLRLKPGTAR